MASRWMCHGLPAPPRPESAKAPGTGGLLPSFVGTDGFADFCRNKSRSPKAQPGILRKIGLRLRSACTNLLLLLRTFAPKQHRLPFTQCVKTRNGPRPPVFERNTAPAQAQPPNATQHPPSFAGTDGFADFCRNKSRSPKAQQSILRTTGFDTAQPAENCF